MLRCFKFSLRVAVALSTLVGALYGLLGTSWSGQLEDGDSTRSLLAVDDESSADDRIGIEQDFDDDELIPAEGHAVVAAAVSCAILARPTLDPGALFSTPPFHPPRRAFL